MFNIGENIILNKSYNNTIIKNQKATVISPARLHVSIMNPHNMILEKLGGGGIGIALDSKNIIEIEVIESNEDIIVHSKKAVIEHFWIIMRKLFNTNIHFKVTVKFEKNMKEHSGLASNAMLSTGIIYGVNFIFGNILTKYDIVEILDNNFVEEHNGGLVRDICTGIAHNTCCFGGLTIVSGSGKLIKKYDLPNYLKVFLIKVDKKKHTNNIANEKNIVDLLKTYDNDSHFEKAYMILNEIMPDLDRGSIDNLFKYNYIFQHFNDELNVLDYYYINDVPVRNVLKEFEQIPNVMTGLSTNAKYLYAITVNDESIKELCKNNRLNYLTYSVNNLGVSII